MSDSSVSKYDRIMGQVNGFQHTRASMVRNMTMMIGAVHTHIVQTFREPDTEDKRGGDFISIEIVTSEGSDRFVLPPEVARVIARQREQLSTMSRKRAAKLKAKQRKAQGIVPFQKKGANQ